MENSNCFVTLFDSKYLIRGLAMYESLINTLVKFTLFIIAFDDITYEKLSGFALKNVCVISLKEFEDDELKRIKGERTQQEYCWSCSAKAILYILEKYMIDVCTYIDADLFFYANPQVLIDELADDESVIITEHRYAEYCDSTSITGKYCVQFITFKRDENGMQSLRWWKDRCMEWCFAEPEDGKFGDQVYLNEFPVRFKGVHELRNIGGGVAPWNVSRYSCEKHNNQYFIYEKETGVECPLVFYHFHGLKFFDKDVVNLAAGCYIIPDSFINKIYKEYICTLRLICEKYNLGNEMDWYTREHFRDNDLNNLCHDRNYYRYSLFDLEVASES